MEEIDKLEQTEGYVHSVDSYGAVDGPGVRFVVFFQGCPLRCLYCHNPDTWEFGKGTRRTAGELADEILDYKNFIRKGGVTLSGGEPLAQPEFAYAMLRLCAQNGFHTALDTSGAVPLSVSQKCIDAASLILLDIKALVPAEAEELTGVSNANTLATLDYCESVQKPVWVRHVCLPGYTLDTGKLTRLAEFLKPYRCIECVELIPFHQMGIYKWEYIDAEYQLAETPVPDEVQMEGTRKLFRDAGFTVK